MRVCFRTDGSLSIGIGHVMRCLALATELRRRGDDCVFLMRNLKGSAADIVADAGFPVVSLACGPDWRDDADQTLAAIGEEPVNWLLVDHYGLAAEWEEVVRSKARRVAVIDDLADRRHACDLIIDHNIGRQREDYAPLVPEGTECLVGSEYALLRAPFASLRQAHDAKGATRMPRHMLVALGGGDSTEVTRAVLASMQDFSFPEGFRLTVVVGSPVDALDEVRRAAGRLSCATEVICNPPDFPELLAASDIAIGAGGVTALERCCLGIPSIIVVIAENQRRGAMELGSLGAASVISDVSHIGSRLPGMLASLLDPAVAAAMSACAMTVADGLGIRRVVDIMRRSEGTRVAPDGSIRRMHEGDLAMVLAWRNHPDIRTRMLDQDFVREDKHWEWFAKANLDPGRTLLIYESEGRACGFAQFTETRRGSGVADWGFYAAPDAPKGSGRNLCRSALRFAFDILGYHKVCGQVLDFNLRSQAVHLAVGFRSEGVLRQHHRCGARYCDVLCFGCLSSEWKNLQESRDGVDDSTN